MRVPRPSAAGLASAVTAAAVLVAVPAAAAQAGSADSAGTAAATAVSGATAAAPAAVSTVCGTYGTMNAYIWASAVRVHTGPSESNTAIGECGPSWVHAYCQLQGGEVVDGAYRNNWWIYADTRLGGFVNGYISGVFVSGGGNDAPVPGVPVCSS
jgi:eukaryotic-like serine/threonine-protein kinase